MRLAFFSRSLGRFRFIPGLLLGWLLAAVAAAAEPRVTFYNSITALPTAVAATQRTLLATNQLETMEFGVALKLRDFDQMQARIERGETISREELERVYLPLAADYDAVRQWLSAQGLTITWDDSSRLVVYARGTLAQVQQSLQVHLVAVTANGGQDYRAADTAPSLPLEIATPVLGINHLQPFHQRAKHGVLLPLTNNAPPFKVAEILKAYDGASLGVTGAGQKIAILIDTAALNSDLTAFWTANGIAQSTANIEVINVNGGTLPAPTGEESLDEEWTSGVAPGAGIRVYAAGSLSDSNLDKSLQRLINDLPTEPQLHQLSISLGLGETYVSQSQFTTDQQLFATIASGGVSTFVSSGDGGSTPDSSGGSSGPLQVEHYASDPSVTAVGGTSLTVNASTGLRTAESTWSGSGGGVSIQFARPSWQTGTGVPTGTKRCVPDVAFTADPNTGAYVVLTGGVHQYGGTSWSAPMWAGYCALINEARAHAGKSAIGSINPSLYPLIGTNNFLDITTGSNATSGSGGKYAATVGYDQATGLGTPDMANLLATLAGLPPAAPTVTGFTPTSGVQHTAVVITGTSLGTATAVAFNGTSASFTVNSATQITAFSPANATTGPIAVTNPTGSGSSSASFTVIPGAAAPTITGFSPAYGPVGTTVVLNGTDFTGATAVRFNGTAAAFGINSATQLSATVPSGATSGVLTVTTTSGTATSSASFSVLAGDGTPTITGFTPTTGSVGTPVTITGTNFVNVASVTFGGVAAVAPTVGSATQILATVPTGAVSGPIVVTTGLGTASSAASFAVNTLPIVLAGWNVAGLSGYGSSPLGATTTAAGLAVVGLTRGPGVTTGGTAAADAWGGNGFNSSSASAAVSAGDYATCSVTAASGFTVSFSSVSRFDYRRSGSGPGSGLLQFQVGGSGSWTDVTTVSYSSSSGSGASLGAISLAGFSALQGVPAGTAVSFRIVNYGASSSGGNWYIFNVAGDSAADFALSGNVNAVAVPTPDLTVTKTHAGTFTQGDIGRTYTLGVANGGTGPTSGAVTLQDMLPTGLTATAMSGTGWTVNLAALTATRSDVLAAGGSYPPLTVTVDVAATAPATVTNLALVAGGGETNTANDTAGDATTIAAAPPQIRVETQPDGTGTLVPAGNLGVGSSLAVYAVSRTAAGVFTANAPATWSFGSLAGGVQSGDLVAATDGRSATFTPSSTGSATIHAAASGFTAVDSGVTTVTAAPVNPAAATNLAPGSATLNGTVNPSGTATSAYFEYGPTTAYGQATPALAIGSGGSPVNFTADLVALNAGTVYHFRLVVVAGGTTTRYADQVLTLPAAGDDSVPLLPPWGLAVLGVALVLVARAVLRRRLDPV